MSVSGVLKTAIKGIPEPVARPLAYIPFSLRLGSSYARFASKISAAEMADSDALDAERLKQLQSVLHTAYRDVKFYRDFYRSKNFVPGDIKTLSDWEKVPLVTKEDLQGVPLIDRCTSGADGMLSNTGGTSGRPLEFMLDKDAVPREWAHMHYIWKARGYRPWHLKIRFTGKHFEGAKALHYHPMHNEYIVNANSPMIDVVKEISQLRPDSLPRWVHGYPSLIADFAHTLSTAAPDFAALFRMRLYGALLGSEFPAPVYRDVIEQVLSSNVVSWYGHSEMALLARETTRGVYESLSTYGYAEAVPLNDLSAHKLVCTSFHNKLHPFIRYETGDLISPVSCHRGSLAFHVREGRIGDFVLDRLERNLSLTSIIFGRHHTAFEGLQHLQVRQDAPGKITLLVVVRQDHGDVTQLRKGFDFNGLDLTWSIEIIDQPIRTPAGKIRLKVN